MKFPINEPWGKLDRNNDTVDSWHPLRHHCCDVAACFTAIFNQRSIKQRFIRLAPSCDFDETMMDRLKFMAYIHDLGKCNSGFQTKIFSEKINQFKSGHVKEALSMIFKPQEDTARKAEEVFSRLLSWNPMDSLMEFICSSVCHHGRPYKIDNIDSKSLNCWLPFKISDFNNQLSSWWMPDKKYYDPLAELDAFFQYGYSLFPGAASETERELPIENEFYHAFNGILILADWIGSNPRVFPFSKALDEDRWSFALSRAERVVESIGLNPDKGTQVFNGVSPSFNAISEYSPYPMQALVEEIVLSQEGTLSILEAETGSGKTEAALLHFLRLFSQGLVDGMYFALPTRTSAFQMWERIEKISHKVFKNSSYSPHVVLAVPGYLNLNVNKDNINFETLCDDEMFHKLKHWASEHSKQYFAGAIVIGTIDQVLLSGLKVPHTHLRASLLLRSLLIVDEVHASDAYMNSILRLIINRQLKAGGHVLLMSATLGSSSKHMFESNFYTDKMPSLEKSIKEPFPLITVISKTKNKPEKYCPQNKDTVPCKKISLSLCESNIQNITIKALDAASRGARVLVIRNTVNDCIKTQKSIEKAAESLEQNKMLFTLNGTPSPHHARYARSDRQGLDKRIEQCFGKQTTQTSLIAVATQTVQQSLDIDADYLITDLCPADVLLQRLGRLHRHQRKNRPVDFSNPQALILTPNTENLADFIKPKGRYPGAARGPFGFGSVYEDLRILDMTWKEIKKTSTICIPNDCRVFVENCTHPDALEAYGNNMGPEWKSHELHVRGTLISHRSAASINVINWSDFFSQTEFEKDNESHISTRLGLNDRIVSFKPHLKGPFGFDVQIMTIPGWLIPASVKECEPENIKMLEGGFTFNYNSIEFLYNRLGLTKITSDPEKEFYEYD